MTAVAEHKPQSREVQAATDRQRNPIMEMIAQAVSAGQSIEIIRELKDMAKELAADEARRAFEEAVSEAKAELKPIVRRSKGHNGNYADLATIADAIDPIISRHGLSYRHRLEQGADALTVTCILSHKSGHREETGLTAAHDKTGNKNPIQALGSTQQYLMRYTLLASLGLSTAKDDDGRMAGSTDNQFISDAERKELEDLIAKTSSDIEKFCSVYHIDALSEMPKSSFSAAKNTLKMKLARQSIGGDNG